MWRFRSIVCSAHRTPDKAAEFAKGAEENGFDVIIAGAGKAAHLPGVLAALRPFRLSVCQLNHLQWTGLIHCCL